MLFQIFLIKRCACNLFKSRNSNHKFLVDKKVGEMVRPRNHKLSKDESVGEIGGDER